jgi:hypothetical protein
VVHHLCITPRDGGFDGRPCFVHNHADSSPSVGQEVSAWYKLIPARQLPRNDTKMKYMIGMNAVFGFTAAFFKLVRERRSRARRFERCI